MAMNYGFCSSDFCQPAFLAGACWGVLRGGPGLQVPLQAHLTLLAASVLAWSPYSCSQAPRCLFSSPRSSFLCLCSFFLHNVLLNSWLLTRIAEL